MSGNLTTSKKLDELYELIGDIEIAMMTTRRPDGLLVSRPMATQKKGPLADVWFVTNIEADKVDELESDPHVNLAYLDGSSKEWVSVSGKGHVCQDREKIRQMYEPDWKAYFGDEGGARDGGPDDPRMALILIDALTVRYMKAKHSLPVTLFEVVKGMVTGDKADIGREEALSRSDLA